MRIVISLLSCALLLTGCSGSDGDSADDGRTPAAQRNTNSISQAPKAAPSRWAVVGVEQGDVLNVRRKPRASAKVLARLAPLTTGVKVGSRTSGAWRQAPDVR
ncbi:MAG: hypothetical protein EOO74_09920, partial [Myxococcales bacterium]